ncbi:tRNA-dihydrouridine synthase C [Aquicella siphonis]|uniref:tRNA-dihydrouridine synthase n=1 Tax=Aquicella siphonis TaxID=254247 RepID=A0A5E4PJ74_9COXI|nr:tRNA-dihydrouridine synthase [Aquicella siphonis]VVC76432.1 tRNA-dihydrouridine synthase C [Aquicella siphonis]
MIRPLQLGSTTFPVNLIQGPLAGISCAPFRRLTWQYSQPAFSCTEMISCKTLIHQTGFAQKRYTLKDPGEGPVCFQLSGGDPRELAEAVRIATDQGADLIDLNCGCPVRKIRSKGAGSSLLTDASRLYHLISAMKQNTHVPVSVKIRVEGGGEKFNQEVAAVVSDAGADYLIVHGRHWTEHYETACRHEAIRYFVQAMKIPVIGNGDVADLESLKKMFATGCAGVMIGRAGVGQPWLIRQLINEMQQTRFALPSAQARGGMFMEHVERLSELLGNDKFAILQARTFAKYYARGMTARTQFAEAVNACEHIEELRELIARFFC